MRVAFSPAECAEMLGVSTRTVQRLLDSGQLFYVQVQSRRRVPMWAITEFLSGDAA